MSKEEFWKLFEEKKLKSITVDIRGMFIQYTLNEESGNYETYMGAAKLVFNPEPEHRGRFEILDYVRV